MLVYNLYENNQLFVQIIDYSPDNKANEEVSIIIGKNEKNLDLFYDTIFLLSPENTGSFFVKDNQLLLTTGALKRNLLINLATPQEICGMTYWIKVSSEKDDEFHAVNSFIFQSLQKMRLMYDEYHARKKNQTGLVLLCDLSNLNNLRQIEYIQQKEIKQLPQSKGEEKATDYFEAQIIPASHKNSLDIKDPQLKILSEFESQINTFTQEKKITPEQRVDALKSINCLMFIKINGPFLAYAYQNQNADSMIGTVFKNKNDFDNKLIRDPKNTALHLNSNYSNAQTFASTMLKLVNQIEKIIELATEKNQLVELTMHFWHAVCIDACTRPVIDFGVRLNQAEYIPTLDDLFRNIYAYLNVENNYSEAYKRLKSYMHKKCLYTNKDGNQELIFLTKQYIDQYMEKLFGISENQKSPADVFELIDSGNALVSVITLSSYQSTYLPQWLDPEKERHTSDLSPTADRSWTFILKDKSWRKRQITKPRNQAKIGTFWPKKSPNTLLPPRGCFKLHSVELANTDDIEFITIYDIDSVHLRDQKYLCLTEFEFDKKLWIHDKEQTTFDETEYINYTCASLDDLQAYLLTNLHKKIPQNQILASTPISALKAIATKHNTVVDRLKLWIVKHHFDLFNINLSMLVLQKNGKKFIYDEEMQINDVLEVLQSKQFDLSKINCFSSLKDKLSVNNLDLLDCFIQHNMLTHVFALIVKIGVLENKYNQVVFKLLINNIDKLDSRFFPLLIINYKNTLFTNDNLKLIDQLIIDRSDQFSFYVSVLCLLFDNDGLAKFLYQKALSIMISDFSKLNEIKIYRMLERIIQLSITALANPKNNEVFFTNIFNLLNKIKNSKAYDISLGNIAAISRLTLNLFAFSELNSFRLFSKEILRELLSNIFNKIEFHYDQLTAQISENASYKEYIYDVIIDYNICSFILNPDCFHQRFEASWKKISDLKLNSDYDQYCLLNGASLFFYDILELSKFCLDILYEKSIKGNKLNLGDEDQLKFIELYIDITDKTLAHDKLISHLEFGCKFILDNNLLEIGKDYYLSYLIQLFKLYKESKEDLSLAITAYSILSLADDNFAFHKIQKYFNTFEKFQWMFLTQIPALCLTLLNHMLQRIINSLDVNEIKSTCQQAAYIYKYLSNYFSDSSSIKDFCLIAAQCLCDADLIPQNERILHSQLLSKLIKLYSSLQLINPDIIQQYFQPFFYFIKNLKENHIAYNHFLTDNDKLDCLIKLVSDLKSSINIPKNDKCLIYQKSRSLTLFNQNKLKRKMDHIAAANQMENVTIKKPKT